MDFFFALVFFILLSAIVTYLIKVKTKFDTYFLVSLIKTKRPLSFLTYVAERANSLEVFSEISIFLGFGAIGVDFLYGRQQKLWKRGFLFALSFAAFALFMVYLDWFFGGVFSKAPLTKDFFLLLVAIFALCGFSGFILFSLALQGFDIISKVFAGKTACPGVAPILPGVQLPNVPVVIPLHAWLSLFIILVVHEGMHGIIAIMHKFKIKSTGIILFGFLPIAAFVEPDEKELEEKEKSKPRDVLRFLAAGSGGNLLSMPAIYVLIIIFALLVSITFSPWREAIRAEHPQQVYVSDIQKSVEFCGDIYESPAYGVIDENWQIVKVNGKDVNSLSFVEAELSLNRFKEASFTFIKTDGNIADITLKPNELGAFGFSVYAKTKDEESIPKSFKLVSSLLSFVFDFLSWLFMLSFLMAIANFLPMTPFDGGRMARIIFAPYFPIGKNSDDRKNNVAKFFFYLTLAIFAVNVVPLFL